MDCFDENIIVEFLDGSLSPGQVVEVQRHLDGCGACRKVLAADAEMS